VGLRESHVQQGGVVAEIAFCVAQQVRAQRFEKRFAAGGQRGGAFGERLWLAGRVACVGDPVRVQQHGVAWDGSQRFGLRLGTGQVEQSERQRRRVRVEQRGPACAQPQRSRMAAADDLRVRAVVNWDAYKQSGHELLAAVAVGDERVQPGRDHLQRVRARGQRAEGAGHLRGGLRGTRAVAHYVADQQHDSAPRLDGAGDVATRVARRCRGRARDPRERTQHVSTGGRRVTERNRLTLYGNPVAASA
jgi:hypothetical protein